MTEVYCSPSDFAFGFDECPRCWWLSRVPDREAQIEKPMVLPEIFRSIDSQLKAALEKQDIGHGEFHVGTRVQGYYESCGIRLKISGYPDLRSVSNGGFGIWDLKATRPAPDRLEKYRKQLHAYDYCLDGKARALGLLVWSPQSTTYVDGQIVMMGALEVMPMDIDRGWFLESLDQVCTVAAMPRPPKAGQGCPYCAFGNKRHALAVQLRTSASTAGKTSHMEANT